MFLLLHKKNSVIPINSSIEVIYIWTIAGFLSDTLSGGFQWFPGVSGGFWWFLVVFGGFWWFMVVFGGFWWFPVVSGGFRWFPGVSGGYSWLFLVIARYPWFFLVILGYPWLSLVIPGYPWLSLVILGYPWLSLVIPGYLTIILFGRDCRRFLQMSKKIIENAKTISHILESHINRDNQGSESLESWLSMANCTLSWKFIKKSVTKNMLIF